MKTGIIGCGKMASALIKGAVHQGAIKGSDLYFYSRTAASAEQLAKELHGTVASSLPHLAQDCEALILCTKPAQIPTVLEGLERLSNAPSRLIISIAAGVSIQTIQNTSHPQDRLIRAMPNTPCLLGVGAIGYFANATTTPRDLTWIQNLFQSVALAIPVQEEDHINAVTALSGSGPAYFYTIIEAFAQRAAQLGLPAEDALALSTQTALGAATMLQATQEHPATLREQVTSPGGTTLAGLEAFKNAGLNAILSEGINAAYQRAQELSKS